MGGTDCRREGWRPAPAAHHSHFSTPRPARAPVARTPIGTCRPAPLALVLRVGDRARWLLIFYASNDGVARRSLPARPGLRTRLRLAGPGGSGKIAERGLGGLGGWHWFGTILPRKRNVQHHRLGSQMHRTSCRLISRHAD